MADPIALLSKAIDIARKLREISQKIKDAETQNLIADLSIAIADTKAEVASLKEENLRLSQEIKKFKKKPDVKATLEMRGRVYYLKEVIPGKPSTGPYCPRCQDADDRLILLSPLSGLFHDLGNWSCPQCRSQF